MNNRNYINFIVIIIITLFMKNNVVLGLPLGILAELIDSSPSEICGDISNMSNISSTSFKLIPKAGQAIEALSKTLTPPQSSTASESSSSHSNCVYYNSKSTVINSLETFIGDRNASNILNIGHKLQFKGSLLLSFGSSINVGCEDDSECLTTHSLFEIGGVVNILNSKSVLGIQSDLNISKGGVLKTNKSSSSSSSSTSTIINSNNFNNNGGLFNIDLPISINTNLFNINDNGIVNVNSPLKLNSTNTIFRGKSSLNLSNTLSTGYGGINLMDGSIMKLTSNLSSLKSRLLNITDSNSSLVADNSSFINVDSFLSNGNSRFSNSIMETNKEFKIGKGSIMNIDNEGGIHVNGLGDISGNVNVNSGGYFITGFGDLHLKDSSRFKVNTGSIDIRSNIIASGNSVFENEDSIFQFMGSSIEMHDNSIFKLSNCNEVNMESSLTSLLNNAQFQIISKSNVNTNNPFKFSNNTLLLIDQKSSYHHNNNKIDFNDRSQILVQLQSTFSSYGGEINMNGNSNFEISNKSIVNLTKGSSLNLKGGNIVKLQSSSILNMEDSDFNINDLSSLVLHESDINTSNGLSSISGLLSINKNSKFSSNNSKFSISSTGILNLNESSFINHQNLQLDGYIQLIGSSYFENNGEIKLNLNSLFGSPDNGDHIINNNKNWIFSNSNNNESKKLNHFNNNGNMELINMEIEFIQFNTSSNSILKLTNNSKLSINNTLIHHGNINGIGIVNTDIHSSSNSSIGNINSISNITINGSLIQNQESQFNIFIKGNETEGVDYTIINILKEFIPDINSVIQQSSQEDKGVLLRSLLSISSSSSSDSSSGSNKTINIYLNNTNTYGNITFLKYSNQSTLIDTSKFNIKIKTYDPNLDSYKTINDICKYQLSSTKTSLSLLVSPSSTCEIITDSDGNTIAIVKEDDGDGSNISEDKKKIAIVVVLSVVALTFLVGVLIWKKRKINNFIKIKRESFFTKMNNSK